MATREHISPLDVIKICADIQTNFTENYKKIQAKYGWQIPDARAQILINCSDVAANVRFSMALLLNGRSNGLYEKDWWVNWAMYNDTAFDSYPDFKIYAGDKFREYIHRLQDQLIFICQVYIESFVRNICRQYNIDDVNFWKLKKELLEIKMGFNEEELKPLVIFQHLKNSLHNKGLHFNKKNPSLEFALNRHVFTFNHTDIILISWDHIRELLITSSDLLYKIITHPLVNGLTSFKDENVIILTDKDI